MRLHARTYPTTRYNEQPDTVSPMNMKSRTKHSTLFGRVVRVSRRGISLLEILLALAVAVVGIFGVLVLMPLSARMAEIGLDLDDAGTMGRSALHEFDVRGMRDAANWAWVHPDPTLLQPPQPPVSTYTPTPYRLPAAGNSQIVYIPANASICIDPEYVGRNFGLTDFRTTGAFFPTPILANNLERPSFPQVYQHPGRSSCLGLPAFEQSQWLTPLPSMHRVNLWRIPRNPNQGALLESAAAHIFASLDDLQFEEPDDTTNPARQQYYGEELFDPTNPDFTLLSRRQTIGKTSWFAIITPRPTPNSPFQNSGGLESDLYSLYIVVCRDRDINLSSQLPTLGGDQKPERWSRVTFLTGGLSGGEVLLTACDPNIDFGHGSTGLPDVRVGQDIDLNRDEWIMLCQRIEAARAVPTQAGPYEFQQVFNVFRWYRVADVDELDLSGPLPSRRVTLSGPDWQLTPQVPPGALWFPTNGSWVNGFRFGPVYAVSVKGVVEVYEKSIRLDSSSIWTQ